MKTQEELAKELEGLKAKNEKVYTIEAYVDGELEATVYLKKLDRITYFAARNFAIDDEARAVEFVLKNQYLGGDDLDIILRTDELFIACLMPVTYYLGSAQGSLKKN